MTTKRPIKRNNTEEGSKKDENAPGPSLTSISESKSPINRKWTAIVLFGSFKSHEDLKAIQSGQLSSQGNDDIFTARKMGRCALAYCFCETCLSAFVGIMWNFDWTSGSTLLLLTSALASFTFIAYLGYRLLLIAKSMIDQIYFIRDEIQLSRNQIRPESRVKKQTQARPESQRDLLHRSDQSIVTSAPSDNASIQTTSPSPSPSRPLSVIEQWSTGREHQKEFGPPGRVDTEADIGIVPPPARRKTFPPQQNGEDA